MFISVKIDNLNDLSNSIPLTLNNDVKIKSEITNIKTVRKYLLISVVSKLTLEKKSLFINTFFGLLKESIWFMEYLVNE